MEGRVMAPTRMIFGGIPNLIDPRGTVIGGTNAAPLLPLSEVLNQEPSAVSRITVTDPWDTYWGFQYGAGAASFVVSPHEGFFVGNHNLEPTAQYRFIGNADSSNGAGSLLTQRQRERLVPTVMTVTSGSVTGVVGNVDNNPLTPDGLVVTTTSISNASNTWSALFDFNTPAAAPGVGADLQSFVLYGEASGGFLVAASVKVELYESGVFVADLGTKYIPGGRSFYLIFPWNASLLGTASGANVQCKITAAGGNNFSWYKLDELAWDKEGGSTANGFQDSGWLTVPTITASSDTTEPQPTKNLFYIPSAAWEINKWILMVRGAHYYTTSSIRYAPAPSTYVQIGVLSAGEILELTGASGVQPPGPSIRVITEERGGVTEGGQTYASDAFRRRAATVDLQLTRANLNLIMDRIDWRKGHSGAFWIALEPGLASADQQFMTFWCTLKEAGDATPIDQQYTTDSDLYLFRRQMVFEEKL